MARKKVKLDCRARNLEGEIEMIKDPLILLSLRLKNLPPNATMTKVSTDGVMSMSKHGTKTSVDVYTTEINPEVCDAMSGFPEDFDYHAPRIDTQHPENQWWEQITDILCPLRRKWILQRDSKNGHKSKAAVNFLDDLLPFLCKVAFQDSMYWIRHWPTNEASRLLRTVLPPSRRFGGPAQGVTSRQVGNDEENGLAGQYPTCI
jgi:hypothetical protein